MATTATQVVLDTPATEFRLPATDGKTYTLDDVAGEKGTVVVFICNHCPYVKAVIDRMISDARVLMSESVGFTAICSNDAASVVTLTLVSPVRPFRGFGWPTWSR
jgi:peroxiredoxin